MFTNNGNVYQVRLVNYVKSQQWVIVNYSTNKQHSAYERLIDARKACYNLNKWRNK